MSSDGDWPRIVERITDRQVLALEQAAIRISGTTFEEGPRLPITGLPAWPRSASTSR